MRIFSQRSLDSLSPGLRSATRWLCVCVCETGSGQQSVTGVTSVEDSNSYWSVRGTSGAMCYRGMPVKCGQTIRLTHVNTGRNLHSHYFASPLSSNQVSGNAVKERRSGSMWRISITSCWGLERMLSLKTSWLLFVYLLTDIFIVLVWLFSVVLFIKFWIDFVGNYNPLVPLVSISLLLGLMDKPFFSSRGLA